MVFETTRAVCVPADGDHRKPEDPKKKRADHVPAAGTSEHPAIRKLQRGEPVLNSELRKAASAFRCGR